MRITKENLDKYNERLRTMTPSEIVRWAIDFANAPVVTTKFGPYSASILHLVVRVKSEIKVIWCDTGFNTPHTYKHSDEVTAKLNLNLFKYVPHQSASQTKAQFGGIPDVASSAHKDFSEQVKLEPFRRAMSEHQPDVWFTNIRKGQTSFRDSVDILSFSKDNILKVSPFYYWTDEDIKNYLVKNNLPIENKYFDPTKVLLNRECGIHI